MSPAVSFPERLVSKVQQQLGSQKVGYLLGAGASYLDGTGYPLAGELWENIKGRIQNPERDDIQNKLDEGAAGLEEALDQIDDNPAIEKPHRILVTEAIAEHFETINPPLDLHKDFLYRLSLRPEISISIYSLNYDVMVEMAADTRKIRIVDGFLGFEKPFFHPQLFQECVALTHRGPRKPQADWRTGILHLYKLHGSVGWFQLEGNEVHKLRCGLPTSTMGKRLMIPPHHRKANDTTGPPYASLWSEFRSQLCQGPHLLNRLVTIGYGFRDEHINPVIENALARGNFTLLIFAHSLTSDVFARWSSKNNVIVVTQNQCALYGEVGPGHPELWSFEELTRRV